MVYITIIKNDFYIQKFKVFNLLKFYHDMHSECIM